MVYSLINCSDYEASQLADQSTFDEKKWVVTTQFANSVDFLERVKAELGFDGDKYLDGSTGNGAKNPKTPIEISANAKASLALGLNDPDMDLAQILMQVPSPAAPIFLRRQVIPPIDPSTRSSTR
jgi:hypothetical protein